MHLSFHVQIKLLDSIDLNDIYHGLAILIDSIWMILIQNIPLHVHQKVIYLN